MEWRIRDMIGNGMSIKTVNLMNFYLCVCGECNITKSTTSINELVHYPAPTSRLSECVGFNVPLDT